MTTAPNSRNPTSSATIETVGGAALRSTKRPMSRLRLTPRDRAVVTYSLVSTLMMLVRRLRMTSGAVAIAKVTAGRMIELMCSGVVSPNPPTGNSPVGRAISRISRMPTQNDGMARPSSPPARTTWSVALSALTAVMIPKGTATSKVKAMPKVRSQIVTGSRSAIRLVTDSLDL